MKNVRQPGSATEKRIMPAFLDQQTVVAVHLVPRIPVHIWAKWRKTRQKLIFKKIVRLTDHAYCLEQFDNF